MADIIKVARIDELEPLPFQNVESGAATQAQSDEQTKQTSDTRSGETLSDVDLTIVSHVNGATNKTESRSVALNALRDYIVDYFKKEKPLKFGDLDDGDEIMDGILNRDQLNSFTDRVYSKSDSIGMKQNTVQSNSYDYYTTEEDIVFEEDCIAHVHANIRLGGVTAAQYNSAPKVDDVIELQLKNADNEWVQVCSQQLNSISGLIELDYHMKVQAGSTFRIATNKRGAMTHLNKSGRINIDGSSVTIDKFSNDTPFINSITSKYVALGNSKVASTPIDTSQNPVVVKKNGVVWFRGTYTQASEISASINFRPYHTQTVYAQASKNDGTNIVVTNLGNTEASIPTNKNIKTEFDFNNLFYYIEADEENQVSITMSADTALYDPNTKSVHNGLFSPTKVTYCSQVSDLVQKFGMDAETKISSIEQLETGFSKPIASFMYAPSQPFAQYRNKKTNKSDNSYIVVSEQTHGNSGKNRSHAKVVTSDKNKPFYIRFGSKSFKSNNESDRKYTYAMGLEKDNNVGIDFIVKNDVLAKRTSTVFPYNPHNYTIPGWKDLDIDGNTKEACWNDFKTRISCDIGQTDPSNVWGAVDFRIDVLSDNVDEVGVFPYKIDDYDGQTNKVNTLVFASNIRPVESYGWFSANLTGFNLDKDIEKENGENFKIGDCAFAFAQNLRSAEIPTNFEFGGDHTFRMAAARQTPLTNLVSADPYGTDLGVYKAKVKWEKAYTSPDAPTSAYYTHVRHTLSSTLSSVTFASDKATKYNICPNDEHKVHVTNGILRNTFVNCKNLLSANIQATDAKELVGTFINCESLKDVIIPTGCTKIGQNAFAGTHGLRRISIPTSVSEVDESAGWNSRTAINRTSSSSWITLGTDSTAKRDLATLKNQINGQIKASVNGNYGMKSVTITSATPRAYGNVDGFDQHEYEIDIRLSGSWSDYKSGGNLVTALIHEELSSTVNALNRSRSQFSGIIWFPYVIAYISGNKYKYRYLPPRGNIFYITDKEGNYHIDGTQGGALVYDSMLLLRNLNITDNMSSPPPVPTTATYKIFVGDKWYNYDAKKNNKMEAVYNSTFNENDTNVLTDNNTPRIFSYNKTYLTYLSNLQRYYGPSTAKIPYKF